MTVICPFISIITLNVNVLNSPVKKQRLADQTLCTRDSLEISRYRPLESEKRERYSTQISNQKRAQRTILTSEKNRLKIEKSLQEEKKKRHYVLINTLTAGR